MEKKGDPVSAGGLSAVARPSSDFGLDPAAPEARRRRQLADWIADRDNPLTFRVMANRVWHYHFGTGLVATPNDLGASGDRPSHPELLDWLACELRDGGSRLKTIHRLIVTSDTYKQSSRFDAKAAAKDADARLLWRFPPRRLEGEAVRDAMLSASGELNPSMYGPRFRPFTVKVFNSNIYTMTDPIGPEFNRRTIYRIHVLSAKSPLLDALDCPDPAVKTPRRGVTTTPLQALAMMNDTFVIRQAKALADRARRRSRRRCFEGSRSGLQAHAGTAAERRGARTGDRSRQGTRHGRGRMDPAERDGVRLCLLTPVTRISSRIDAASSSTRARASARLPSRGCWPMRRRADAPKGDPDRPPHHPARVKRVVQIFACGGVSHVDTFDHKPELIKRNGQELTGKGKIETFFGQPGRLLKSPFEFARHGECGRWVSDLLPNLATCVDDMTFLHAMVAKSSNHTPATFQMNSGFTMNGFPCLGAWLSYGLGTENEDLPTFVVLPDPRGFPAGGSINWTSGFLPANHQGVAFRTSGEPIPDLFPPKEIDSQGRRAGLGCAGRDEPRFASAHPGDTALEARIRSYELAGRMQASIPEAIDFGGESAATRALYGLDSPVTEGFGRNCLLARRLLERGVRFVQLYHGGAFGSPRINWDAHEDVVENHGTQAACMDRPVAGLLKDLKARGLLDDTLVLWTTEFGRTPFTQGIGGKGRDHHQLAFTCWMAGGGLKPGFALGAIGRGRLSGRRGPDERLRPPRHGPAPARDRPQAADVLSQRHPAAPDRRPRRGDREDPRLSSDSAASARSCHEGLRFLDYRSDLAPRRIRPTIGPCPRGRSRPGPSRRTDRQRPSAALPVHPAVGLGRDRFRLVLPVVAILAVWRCSPCSSASTFA